MYKSGDQSNWTGRKDEGSVRDVWHQVVKATGLNKSIEESIYLLGFCSDVGVKRNFGRVGATAGPDAIRKAMVNLAVHFDESIQLFDGGDVVISADQLETGQLEMARYVQKMVSERAFPILLGGGHEISYSHGKGVLDLYSDSKVGMINFDPHFDLRNYTQGSHSGSWARQLFDEYDNFNYLPIGINEAVNIQPMFDLMREKEQSFITMDELLGESKEELNAQINFFIDSVDHVCITLDLDVFSAGIAPGVSAINSYGALPHHIKPLIKEILNSNKVTSFDVAEMNPSQDNDGRTAKLAANFIYDVVNTHFENRSI